MPATDPSNGLARRQGGWPRRLDAATLRADAGAALLAALLVLPQGIAFAALAGLPPAWGLYGAVVPTIVAALAGSSHHVLTGPTNALSLALAAALAPLAVAGSAEYLRIALVLTLMVGLIQLSVAALRWGELTHFIAPSVLLGFTSGAAVLIAWRALQDLRLWPQPALGNTAVAVVTLLAALVLRRRWPRGPGLLLALVAGAVVGFSLSRRPGLTVEMLGTLPQAWPPFALPAVTWADVPRLAFVALALTLVALGQTVAVAKALAARSGQVLDINRECLGQGLANTVGSLFSCFTVCGSLNRSVPHWQAGARTPLAGALAGVFVLLLVAGAKPALAWIPLAGIDALLLVVAWSLIDRAQWRELAQLDRREAAVAAGTLAATLLLPLQVAVLAGVAASLVVYLHRTAHPALRSMGFDRPPPQGDALRPFVVIDSGAPECPQLKLLRMEGTVWFGAAAHVADALRALRDAPQPARHLLVMTKSMNFIDPAGAALWEDERVRRVALGGDLYFHRPRPEVLALWRKSGFIDKLGADHLFADKHSAIATIVPRLDGAICARCTARVFDECAQQPGGSAQRPAGSG